MWCSYLRMRRWEDPQYFFPCFQGPMTARKNQGSIKSDMGAFPQMVWKEERTTQVSSVFDDRLPVKTDGAWNRHLVKYACMTICSQHLHDRTTK